MTEAGASPDRLGALAPVERDALAALALGAAPRPRGWVAELLAHPAVRESARVRPTIDEVRLALARLHQGGWIESSERKPGFWRVVAPVLPAVLERLFERVPAPVLREALAHADHYAPQAAVSRITGERVPTLEAAFALVRLELLAGISTEALQALDRRMPWGVEAFTLVETALDHALSDVLFARLSVDWQLNAMLAAWRAWVGTWRSVEGWSLRALTERWLADHSATPALMHGAELLRWTFADYLLCAGEREALEALLHSAPEVPPQMPQITAGRDTFTAALAAQAGRWAEAETGFDAALATLRQTSRKRNNLLSHRTGLLYVASLLGQRNAAANTKALKFCLAEGGKREPVLDTPYGYVALALQMHLGEVPRNLAPFLPSRYSVPGHASPLDLWRWLMRAWLKQGAQAEPLSAAEAQAAGALKAQLRDAGLARLEAELDAAMQVLAGEPAPPWFFVPGPEAPWQAALSALGAVALAGSPESAPAAAREAVPTRLLWLLDVDGQGRVIDLVPHEQKHGARGWGKPKEVPLARLQRGAAALAPHDAAVVAAIRHESYGRDWRLDVASAVAALPGHPVLAFADAPEQLIELAEAGPELDVVQQGDKLRVRMLPTMHIGHDAAAPRWAGSAAEQKELDALRLVCIVRDTPQRARLVRLTPAQKRVAQLLGPEGLEIPREGATQLQQVLAGLGTHFRIHADDGATAQAARELPAAARLRAELMPVGAGLQLRLVAAPFGDEHRADGPRLVPGHGRARIVATLRGEMLGVQRDLTAELAHLEAVLDACPWLPPPEPGAPCEWQLDDPEQALALVEALHRLAGAVQMDWPQGRALRVESAGLAQLALRVHTRQEWLAVQGELQFDEGLVLGLQQLIGAAGSGSRFVPLGEGRYAALTQELRDRLADLAAVAEAHRAKGDDLAALRIPSVAAPWLQEVVQGAQVDYDAGFAAQLRRLDEARGLVPKLPATLQAHLRPYQEEGFEWAMRLAHAGLGACLADDMGLGKTLQALAVLLARAGAGPALVVAPTSLMGNWRAEARRFAPSLSVQIYAEGGAPGERQAAIQAAGPGQVLLVSYPMLQIDAEAFASRDWATLVLDEAQAIKNAAAKRSQAVFALQAHFRFALSGTPIENRLGELWSIMRACNPGLLGTSARFAERFAGPIERQRDKAAQRQLKRLIAPFVLRRTKAQVLDDLPPRTELVLRVQPDETEAAHYEALRRDALIAAERSLEGDAPGQAHLNVLAGLTRLRRAACDPRLVSPHVSAKGAKVQAFAELAAELVANGHKALVFSQFVDFLALLREPLDAAGIAYQYLDGSTPAAERTKRVDAFQAGQGELFLISLKAGGFGLNLTVADYVVIADPWWNPAAEDQASGRAHRIGQQRPVTVYRLVNQGTLEEKILTLHRDKRELADLLLEGTDGAARIPPADELLALMRADDEVARLYE
ncbi:DEAD/DEAH box helicase [Ideonella sp.]|uniref:DEAD/DEAH box helicase n=1 Tax=Ideonella sp. TaxID=1929293 RepID=UPI002B4A6963|nr:DEAD/DEAH box helicase [Ideonella sp.]HJV70619.1 DEAD/DEAH box helicase [Ideonella sp.]